MMRLMGVRRWRGGLVPLVLAVVMASCGAPRPEAHAPEPRAGLPLWEVTDGVNTIHLLGSIHLLRPEVYPLDPAVYEAFDAAEVVVFEVDPEQLAQGSQRMVERGMLVDGRTLTDLVPPDLAEALDRHLAAGPLPAEFVMRTKPWFAGIMLTMATTTQSGFEAGAGIDQHFYERTVEAGKRIAGLETIDDQIDSLDGLGEDAQVALLRSAVEQLDAVAVQLDRLTANWKRGDVEAIAAMMSEGMREHPELMERLLSRRNRNWAPQVEALLRAGQPAMVIVGMAHLVGEGSVVDLLMERGYTIRQVPASGAVVAAP